jgi:hypothetical protein
MLTGRTVFVAVLLLRSAQTATVRPSADAVRILIEQESSVAEDADATKSLIRSNLAAPNRFRRPTDRYHGALPKSPQSANAAVAATITRIGRPYPIRSAIARRLETLESNCSAPIRQVPITSTTFMTGLGADIHIWSQNTCWAMERGERISSVGPWTWLDRRCNNNMPLGCYFRKLATPLCKQNAAVKTLPVDAETAAKIYKKCKEVIPGNMTSTSVFRQATTEYLFSGGLSDLVLNEIQLQIRKVFGQDTTPVPLITVHIRWGDKAIEMDLATITEYVDAVHRILDRRRGRGQHDQPVHIFVSSEDPRALPSFRKSAPDSWSLYGDAMVDEMKAFRPKDNSQFGGAVTAQSMSRVEGTSSLGSLAIAMEANEFVLVLGSNWSRLIDELRTAVIDPMCGGCTFSVPLRQGQW